MTDTLTLTLDSDLAARIKGKVESGEYAEPADVVRAGLDQLDELTTPAGWTVAEMRAVIDESDQEGGEIPIDEARDLIRAELRARLGQTTK